MFSAMQIRRFYGRKTDGRARDGAARIDLGGKK